MNRAQIEALDRELDARADGDLIGALARLRPVDWPERTAGERITERVAAALAVAPAAPSRPRLAVAGSSAGSIPARRQLPAPSFPARRALLAGAAAVAAVTAAAVTVAVRPAGSPVAAPVFHSRFRAAILAATNPSSTGYQTGSWRLASYLITPGWHPHDLTSPAGSLSCPSAAICYVTATRPVSFRAMSLSPQNYNIVEVTHDGGASWTALGLPADISFTTPLRCPQAAWVCVAGATDGPSAALLRTTDGGRTWSARRLGFTSQVSELACSSDRGCVAVLGQPAAAVARYEVKYTRNGGRTWHAGPANPRGQVPDYLTCRGRRCVLINQLIVRDNNRSVNGTGPLTVAGGDWAIWTSADGGRHWRRGVHPSGYWTLPSGDTPTPGALSCSDAAHCWALTSTNWFLPGRPGRPAVLATTDGGLHWSARPLSAIFGPGTYAYAISCPTARHCLVGGGYRRPVMAATTDGGRSWTAIPLPPSVRRITIGKVDATGLIPQVGLLSCAAAGRCLAIVTANPNARRIPVFSLSPASRR